MQPQAVQLKTTWHWLRCGNLNDFLPPPNHNCVTTNQILETATLFIIKFSAEGMAIQVANYKSSITFHLYWIKLLTQIAWFSSTTNAVLRSGAFYNTEFIHSFWEYNEIPKQFGVQLGLNILPDKPSKQEYLQGPQKPILKLRPHKL